MYADIRQMLLKSSVKTVSNEVLLKFYVILDFVNFLAYKI